MRGKGFPIVVAKIEVLGKQTVPVPVGQGRTAGLLGHQTVALVAYAAAVRQIDRQVEIQLTHQRCFDLWVGRPFAELAAEVAGTAAAGGSVVP